MDLKVQAPFRFDYAGFLENAVIRPGFNSVTKSAKFLKNGDFEIECNPGQKWKIWGMEVIDIGTKEQTWKPRQ